MSENNIVPFYALAFSAGAVQLSRRRRPWVAPTFASLSRTSGRRFFFVDGLGVGQGYGH